MSRRPSPIRLALAAAGLSLALAAPAGAAGTGGLQYGATTASDPAPGAVDPSQPLPPLPVTPQPQADRKSVV